MSYQSAPSYAPVRANPLHSHGPVPHYAAATESRVKHLEEFMSSTQPIPLPISTPLHSKPLYLAGSRNKGFKGTFSTFEHMPAGGWKQQQQQLTGSRLGRTASMHQPSLQRQVDLHGAPAQVHRGVTSLRARTFASGTVGVGVPLDNATLSLLKEREWEPNPHVVGGMGVSENFRYGRGEGLAGAQRKEAHIRSIHGGTAAFSTGANEHHRLFDPAVRTLSANNTAEVSAARLGLARSHSARARHTRPFVSAAGGVPSGVGADRSYLSGHPQFPYHYSPFSSSERSLTETNARSYGASGPGFRARCEHHIHHAMKATTARESKRGGETQRHPNMHAVQQETHGCIHNCNGVIQQQQQQQQQAMQQQINSSHYHNQQQAHTSR